MALSVSDDAPVEPDGTVSRDEGWNKMDMEALGAAAGMTLFRPEGQRSGVEGRLKFAQLGSRRDPR